MAAKLGFEVVKQAMLRLLMKKGDDGILLTLPKNELVDLNARITMDRLMRNGIDPNSLTSPDQVINVLDNINNQSIKNAKVISADSAEGKAITEKLLGKKGEVVSFKDKIEAMKKSGDIVDVDDVKISKKITDRDMFKEANQRLKGPIKKKQDMGPFGKVDVETDYSSSINRPEFFDPKAKNMYGETVKTGVDFIQKEKERILNLINNKKKNMVPPTHSNYKLLKKSLQDQEDALEAIKVTEDLGGNENMFDFLRTKNIADYKAKPLQRSNYTKTEAELKAKFDKDNQDSIQRFKDKMKDNPEDMATGGRAGHYTGGIVDVEPSLDDIGHGSDALMARTRLVSPGNQATTSTGLNYLLAEDNDNMRVPFETGLLVEKDKMQPTLEEYLKERGEIERKENSERLYREYLEDMRRKKVMQQKQEAAEGGRIGFAGGNGVADEDAEKAALGKRVRELMDEGFDMGEAVKKAMSEGYAEGGRIGFSAGGGGRRAFLKLMATLGGGVAAAKSGILSLGGKEAGKQTAKEIVKSAGSGTPPPYFFKLVEKIKTLGDDVTVGSSTTPRTKVTKYKNYELTESLDGSKQIQKIGKEDDMITQNEYMTYTKGQADETTKGKKPADDYEEVTETNSRIYKDNFNDPDYEDGINLKEILEEVGETVTKKADGGLTTMLGE
jgi:hypothetical protein